MSHEFWFVVGSQSLSSLQKPCCHLATQYNREIPNEGIDMDFMNLNQAAHGDREHGFLADRLRLPRKVIAGHWQDGTVQARLGKWMRTAIGAAVSRSMKVMRFGDNMREVCPSLAGGRPRIETHHLGIGMNEKDPAPQRIQDKHYFCKHDPGAYYGQG